MISGQGGRAMRASQVSSLLPTLGNGGVRACFLCGIILTFLYLVYVETLFFVRNPSLADSIPDANQRAKNRDKAFLAIKNARHEP